MLEIKEKELFNEFFEGFKPLWDIVESQRGGSFGKLTVQARKVLSEAALFLYELMEEVDLEKTEEEFANSWIRQFRHILGREFEGNFILRIYYFTENYARDSGKTVHIMISLMVALRALETCGPKLTRGGTVWGYLERDMPKFRKAIERILDEDGEEEKIDELFLLLNTIDMLATIKDSKILEQELHELIKIVSEHQESFDKAFEISPGLKVYAADLVDRIELPINISDLPKALSGKPGAFLMLMRLRMGQIPSTDQLERARAILLLCIYGGLRRLGVGFQLENLLSESCHFTSVLTLMLYSDLSGEIQRNFIVSL
jgi:hypothetical protein